MGGGKAAWGRCGACPWTCRVKNAGGDGDEDEVVHDGPEEVDLDAGKDGAGEVKRRVNVSDVVPHEHNAGCLERR